MPGFIPATRMLAPALFFVASAVIASSGTEYLGEARKLVDSGDFKAAVIQLKNALQQDPGQVEARILLGKTYIRLGDGASAEKELQLARKLHVDPARWLAELGEAYLLQRKFQELLEELTTEEVADKSLQARVHTLRGKAQLGLGEREQAEASFQASLQADPGNPGAGIGMAQLAVLGGNREEASEIIDGILDESPDHILALLMRAELDRLGGDHERAVAGFSRILELDAGNLRARLGRVLVNIQQKRFDEATADLDLLDKRSPNTLLGTYLRGVVAFGQQDMEKAAEYLDAVLRMAPGHLPSQLMYGVIAYTQNRLQTADEYLTRARSGFPSNSQITKLLAATKLKLKQIDQAVEILESAPGRDQDAQLLALLGSAYLAKGNRSAGAEALAKAVEIAPDLAALRAQLALGLLAGGETDQAVAELQAAVDLGQDLIQADVLLVLAHIKKKQYAEAVRAAENLKKRMPDNPVPHNLAGLANLAEGNKDLAREQFSQALKIDPAFLTAEINLARLSTLEGDPVGAKRHYMRVLDKDQKHLGAMLGLAALAEKGGDQEALQDWLVKAVDANPQAIQPALLLTNHYVRTKQSLKALAVATELGQRFPDNPVAVELLGRVQLSAGETNNAVASFERLVQLLPNSVPAMLQLANGQSLTNNISGARKTLNEALELEPDSIQARIALGVLELKAGNPQAGLEAARKLQSAQPELAAGFELEGNAHAMQGNTAEAETAYRKAYTLQKSGRLVMVLARLALAGGRVDEGIEILNQWLAEQPGDLAVRNYLGQVLQHQGRRKEAITEYQKVMAADKSNAVLMNNLAWLLFEEGDPKALDVAKAAYEANSKRPEITDTYGWILLHSGKAQEGLVLLQEAMVSFPTNPEITYHVAVGYNKVGRDDEARKLLQRLLKEYPDFSEAEAARSLLRRLGG